MVNMKLVSLIFSSLTFFSQALDLNHGGLVDCIKQYKTTNAVWHAGDLYEHSVWTARTVEQWFNKKSEWVSGLNKKDKKLMVVAAFLHDIGKAGDLNYVYHSKPDHPRTGFNYILGRKKFYVSQSKTFDFNSWFKRQALSAHDRKIVAILAGGHWDFGGLVLRGVNNGVDKKIAFQDYQSRLKKLAKKANYNNGTIDDRLVRMSILISVADIRALQPVMSDDADQMMSSFICTRKHSGRDGYKEFKLESFGKKMRAEFIKKAAQ